MGFDFRSWWLAHAFDSPFRKLYHDPEKILKGHIEQGQTVLDIGCGAGSFSIAMAKIVGEEGRVISVDIRDKLLKTLLYS